MSDPFKNSADVWFLPPASQSNWFPKIDWYLNWQMIKGLDYRGFQIPSETLDVAQKFEIEVPRLAEKKSPLLVAAKDRLPTNYCVVVDETSSLKDWLKKIESLSQGLQSKAIQIFLPKGISSEMAEKPWKNLNSSLRVQFITDAETP